MTQESSASGRAASETASAVAAPGTETSLGVEAVAAAEPRRPAKALEVLRVRLRRKGLLFFAPARQPANPGTSYLLPLG